MKHKHRLSTPQPAPPLPEGFELFPPYRESRTLGEGSFRKDWRFEQTEHFLRCLKNPSRPNISMQEYLREEDDPEVLALYACRTGLQSVRAQEYDFALQAQFNTSWGIGCTIGAMVVAGFTVAEIAGLLGQSVEAIATYTNLFWDVEPLRAAPHRLSHELLVVPDWDATDLNDMSEGVLLTAALKRGRLGVEGILTTHIGLAGDEMASIIEFFIQCGVDDNVPPPLREFFPTPRADELHKQGLQQILSRGREPSPPARSQAFQEVLGRIGAGEPLLRFLPWLNVGYPVRPTAHLVRVEQPQPQEGES
jgi:hypothetical protein